MSNQNHYKTLDVTPAATQAEIKQAYRRLVKQFHPDSSGNRGDHDRIASINAAYEVLGDPDQRRSYDRHLNRYTRFEPEVRTRWESDRQRRTADAQRKHRQRQTGQDADELLQIWLSQVYQPISRLLNQILTPLQDEIDALADDPFDDDLLNDFHAYLEECRALLNKAQVTFRSMPNPPNVAGVAAHLYYCMNQISDGIEELERFTTSYDDHYLHTGQELFRIARGLRREAQTAIRSITR